MREGGSPTKPQQGGGVVVSGCGIITRELSRERVVLYIFLRRVVQ